MERQAKIVKISGYLCIAMAAVELFFGNTVLCVVLLVAGCGGLWAASGMKPRPMTEEEKARRRAEDAAWRAHVQDEIRRGGSTPPPPPHRPESRKAQQRRQAEERRQQAAAAGVACCPRCGSTSLSLNKKGFGGGKATAGMIGFGLGGAVAGTYGMNKMKITCMNCGYTYKPGKKTRV